MGMGGKYDDSIHKASGTREPVAMTSKCKNKTVSWLNIHAIINTVHKLNTTHYGIIGYTFYNIHRAV